MFVGFVRIYTESAGSVGSGLEFLQHVKHSFNQFGGGLRSSNLFVSLSKSVFGFRKQFFASFNLAAKNVSWVDGSFFLFQNVSTTIEEKFCDVNIGMDSFAVHHLKGDFAVEDSLPQLVVQGVKLAHPLEAFVWSHNVSGDELPFCERGRNLTEQDFVVG